MSKNKVWKIVGVGATVLGFILTMVKDKSDTEELKTTISEEVAKQLSEKESK